MTSDFVSGIINGLEGVTAEKIGAETRTGDSHLISFSSVALKCNTEKSSAELLRDIHRIVDTSLFLNTNRKILGVTRTNPLPRLSVRYFDGEEAGEIKVIIFTRKSGFNVVFEATSQARGDINLDDIKDVKREKVETGK
jgi:hypothetical protein